MAKSVPHARRLVPFGKPIIALHAKNAAAKLRIETALANGEKPSPRDFKHVPVQIATHVYLPKDPRPLRTPGRAVSLVTGGKRTPQELAGHAVDMAQMNPQGFRTPSTKPSKQGSTSLVELTSIAAGMMERPEWQRSKRGQKKREALEQTKENIRLEREVRRAMKYLNAHERRELQRVAMAADMAIAAE